MMKRILAFILILATLFSLVSCSSSLENTEETVTGETVTAEQKETEETKEGDNGPITLPESFSAGFGRADVTPATGTSLAGYGAASNRQRLSAVVLDPLMLTCTAISDGDSVALIFSTDNLYVSEKNVDQAVKIVNKLYEIPQANIIINATHTHSAAPIHYTGFSGEGAYLKKYYAAIKSCAEEALRDLKTAEIYIGEGRTENLNYVRRYTSLDGKTYHGKNGPFSADATKHETEADNQMQILQFKRENAKDIVMVNWQCHVTGPGSESGVEVSADWVGAFRDAMEKDGDVHFAYQQGAAGNLAANSAITGEKSNKDYKNHGKELAAVARKAMENMTRVESGKVQGTVKTYTAEYNPEYKPAGGTLDVFLTAISIGDVAFASAPYEMHDTNGMELKNGSPFKMTFMCAYSNGAHGYMASSAAFENGGYEVDSSHFAKGTGEDVVKEQLASLNTLYQSK